jgi:hypothetical protein
LIEESVSISINLGGKNPDEKIIIISHYKAIQCLTGGKYLGDNIIDRAIFSANCEAVPLDWHNLEPLRDQ